MASLSHFPATFNGNLASGGSASGNGIAGVPLKSLGKSQAGTTRRDVSVSAKFGKVKKHEYPWPKDPDPNVKGGVLRHLSPFKPLKEKPKQVILEFEKPLMSLQKKIIDVQKMANETGLDFTDQIISLETKYQQALKDLYTHLVPIQRVHIARHPNRPTFLDHVFNITEKFVELHGDRAGYDDPAMVTGLGSINGRSYMFIGQQKGRNSKENIKRNFGMPTPHGYRKALRMMYYADHHGFPIVTLIDTAGAFADIKSEELGQGEAIANNLRTMFGLKVPIISIIIGEGGSGGALAIGCANKLLMLENSVFFVASPEACAAILWKTSKAAPKAAEKLKITAAELCKLQIADGIIPEPLGGAHVDPYWTSQQIKAAIVETMDELTKMDTQELLKHRMLKFRKLGAFQEGIPLVPPKKVEMKTGENSIIKPGKKLVNKTRKPAKESSTELPELDLNGMTKKLKREVDHEFSKVLKTMGLKDKVIMLRKELAKEGNSKDQSINLALKNQYDKLQDEINQGLSAAPNYASLKYKLGMLKEISKAKNLSEEDNKIGTLTEQINKRFMEVLGQSGMKEKIDAVKKEVEDSAISTFEHLNPDLKAKILQVKEETKTKFADVIEYLGLYDEQLLFSDTNGKMKELNEESNKVIDGVINSSDLRNMIEQAEISEASETSRELDWSLPSGNMSAGNSEYYESRVKVVCEANSRSA